MRAFIKNHTALFLVILILVLSMMYCVVWFVMIQSKYVKWSVGMEELVPNVAYFIEIDELDEYNVKFPGFPTFTGNLCVSTEDEHGYYFLLIWPHFFKKTEFGIGIDEFASNNNNDATDSYSIMLDSDMKPINKYDQEVVNEYYDVIKYLYEKSEERWGKIK